MGQFNSRLKVFENIIDEAEGDFDEFIKSRKGKKQLDKAIGDKNIPYIFIAMIFFGIDLDSDYGVVQLTYDHLLKQNKDKFTENELKMIRSGPRHEQIDLINTFYKKKFKIICENIRKNLDDNIRYFDTKNDLGLTPLASAIIKSDIDSIYMMIKYFGLDIGSYCYIDKNYLIRDLLLENSEHLIWDTIIRFMEKGYDLSRVRQFIFDTIQIKKEFFEVFKLGLLCGFPRDIIHKIIHTYHICEPNIIQTNNIANIERNIISLTNFNNTLCSCDNEPINLINFMDTIENMESLKFFWCWLNYNDELDMNKDIAKYIFQKILALEDVENRDMSLLFIK